MGLTRAQAAQLGYAKWGRRAHVVWSEGEWWVVVKVHGEWLRGLVTQ
jgi:hypothetical protein